MLVEFFPVSDPLHRVGRRLDSGDNTLVEVAIGGTEHAVEHVLTRVQGVGHRDSMALQLFEVVVNGVADHLDLVR